MITASAADEQVTAVVTSQLLMVAEIHTLHNHVVPRSTRECSRNFNVRPHDGHR